jgi:hypothetical protein
LATFTDHRPLPKSEISNLRFEIPNPGPGGRPGRTAAR